MYPNSALSAWQLALIAVVAVSALAVWLVAVFLAARPDRTARASAEGASAEEGVRAAGPGPGPGEQEQADEAGDRLAA